jgi:hypothetical protein
MTAATATAPLLGNMKFTRDNADRASYVVVWDEERDKRILAVSLAECMTAVPDQVTRGVVVELRPRTFTETAAHFQRVATPITWSTDEYDID